jgi:hypothetical protein
MTQKIIIAVLALAVIGVIAFGLIDAARVPQDPTPVALAATDIPTNTPEAAATEVQPTTMPTLASTPLAVVTEDAADAAAGGTVTPAPMIQAQSMMGDPWQAEGTVTQLGDFGFTLATDDGEYFVELGPPTYWQAQDIALADGVTVNVDGYYNGNQVHPVTIITDDGAQIVLRNASGQPVWSGGAENANAQGSDMAQAQPGMGMIQVAPEDWVTLAGTIGSILNGQVTLNADDGSVVSLQMGRPDFWQSQGVTLSAGDPVEVLGFWSGTQFMAGDIRKTATGETIMLRDPNGRQLWAGPGRNDSQGQGGSNQDSQGQGGGGQGSQGQGGGANQSNQGNGYRGGRGDTTSKGQGQSGVYQATVTP